MTSKLKSRITQKGQITIPKEYRDKFKLSTGEEVLFYEDDDRLYIIPAGRFVEELARDMKGVEQVQQETRESFRNPGPDD
ncbi:MAG: AbrB/MazE/SpoVT family DNA-binding domain-containing protein [Candidatus Hodarchaeales archaeon]|jgi:AbrB family looped-hinge helix DNA binding protein